MPTSAEEKRRATRVDVEIREKVIDDKSEILEVVGSDILTDRGWIDISWTYGGSDPQEISLTVDEAQDLANTIVRVIQKLEKEGLR